MVLKRSARVLRHEVRRPTIEHDLVCRQATRRLRRGSRTVRTERHAACRQQRDARDDVVLGCIAMPTDGRARPILVDEGHGKRFGINARPRCNLCAQRHQKRWKWPGSYPIVRLAKERHAAPCHDAAHLEVRKRHVGHRFEQDSLLGLRYEVLAKVEALRRIVLEETWRPGHDPVSHGIALGPLPHSSVPRVLAENGIPVAAADYSVRSAAMGSTRVARRTGP